MDPSFVSDPVLGLHPAREPSRPAAAFDALAMAAWPHVARLLGVTFRVGSTPDLVADAHAVLREVWGGMDLLPPDDVAWVGERYDRATTWIVAYRRGVPVGTMGLLDLRIASMALDFEGRSAPPSIRPDTTREIGRLAIVPQARGGLQVVMVGLLREMLAWCEANGVERLLAGSTERLFRVYARYNPTAHLLYAPPVDAEDPAITAWFEAKRAYGRGRTVLYTFEVAGASPWSVFSRFLTLRLKPRARS